MADKNQQVYPLAPATEVARSDVESSYLQSKELQKKKRLKCFAYIALFAVFQTVIILVFALTVMRIKSPKVRLGAVTIDTVGDSVRITAQVTVKNTNFGHYKFESSMGTITSGGVTIGQFVIPEGRAKARSTKKVYINAELLPSNTGNGVLELISQARLSGKVELMKVIKKKKSADMNCVMSLTSSRTAVEGLNCK
ncbi:unnamed protein product [Ilex paraguariensis]|uniref:Late embryogenesis abundant protein LEA-2 subgroup domain-containing protein n=1 Tax=Ilex paraguariensis TaxID=185542 RepID=A0ABC8RAD4_9AQUA